uniref:Protein P21-like n=1 Tax=Rhizophora mucronata TaxID=61149 RepID=A0A2P2P4V9_RHIMU
MLSEYSANVTGGAPLPRHSRSPLQSPLSHLPCPDPLNLQLVRAHRRPRSVPLNTHFWPWLRRAPPPGTAAAQTV